MITENKICGDKKIILLFNFTDALYYIEYNEEQFSHYERKQFSRAGYKWDEKTHLFIPINDLKFICKRENFKKPSSEVLVIPPSVHSVPIQEEVKPLTLTEMKPYFK